MEESKKNYNIYKYAKGKFVRKENNNCEVIKMDLLKWKAKFFIVFLFCIATSFSYSMTTIKVIKPESDKDVRRIYYLKLLKLSLEKTKGKYGEYKIEDAVAGLQGRTTNLLADGSHLVDVMWAMTNKEREKMMLPIRIPLLKGLMGYRIFIINRKNKEKFSKINRVEELKKLKAVQGHDWPDVDILLDNGFKVEKSTYYEGMFKMIDSGRADYFPRAVNEPFDEVNKRDNLNLIIENNLRFYYFSPIYFFVNIKRPELRDRIEEGLEIAISDGSFDNVFYNDVFIRESVKDIKSDKIKIFKLNNSFLSDETKKLQNNKKYIFDIDFKKIEKSK